MFSCTNDLFSSTFEKDGDVSFSFFTVDERSSMYFLPYFREAGTYSGDLKSGLVWISSGQKGWVANGPDFEWDLKYGSPTIRNPDK